MSYVLPASSQKIIKKFRLQFISGTKCSYCDRFLSFLEVKVDHKTPVSRGGKTVPSNLAACCEQCNSEKGSKLVREYELYLDFKERMDEYSTQYLLDSLDYYRDILRETGKDARDTDNFLVRWKCQAISKLLNRRNKHGTEIS